MVVELTFEILFLKTNAGVEVNSSKTIVLEMREDTEKLTT